MTIIKNKKGFGLWNSLRYNWDDLVCIWDSKDKFIADVGRFFKIFNYKVRTNYKLRPSAVRKHVKCIAQRAGLNRRIWPHLFRHSLAMNMLLRGADLYSVKEELRHEFISTTEIYVKSNPQILRNNYPIFVPQYVWGMPIFQRTPNNVFSGSNSYKFNK